MTPSVRRRSHAMYAVVIAIVLSLCAPVLTAAQEPVTLTYMMWGGVDQVNSMRAILDQFERQHPHIKVEIEVPAGNFWDHLMVRFLSDTEPDVFWMNEPFIQYRNNGWLLDLKDLIENDPDISLDDYFPATTHYYAFDDHVWGIPKDINISVIHYRPDLFEEAGLVANPNWDWTEFEDTLRKLNRYDADGNLVQASLHAPSNSMVREFILQNGNDFYDATNNRLLLDQQNAIEAIEWAKSLRDRDLTPTNNPFSGYANPNVAMYHGARWLRYMFQDAGLPFDILPAPQQVRGGTTLYIGAVCIAASTPHPEEAWELLKWIVGYPGQAGYWGEIGESIPALRSAALDTLLTPPPASPQYYITVLESFPGFLATPYVIDNWGDVSSVIDEELNKVWSGEASALAATTRIMERTAPVLAEGKSIYQY